MSYSTSHTSMDHDGSEIHKSDWVIRIDNHNFSLNHLKSDVIWNRKYPLSGDVSSSRFKTVFSKLSLEEKMLNAEIEESPRKTFECVVNKCINNHYLYMTFANFLSTKTIDALCEHVFSTKGINKDFLSNFYELFLPIFLKRSYSWYTLNVMFRAKKAYPILFKKLIKEVFKDVNISRDILHDFVCNMNPNYKKTFLETICEINMSVYEFSHNIPCIYAAVNGSTMDENTFQFIFNHLEIHSHFCVYNKSYGKLLLCLIENISGQSVRFRSIQKIIEAHCTPYKNMCRSMMEKYINELIAVHFDMQETSRFLIPRPDDRSRL